MDKMPNQSERDVLVEQKIAELRAAGADVIDLLDRAIALQKSEAQTLKRPRVPGQFKGRLFIGPEFFEPLSDEEIRELMGE
jgi:hypothetical protein